MAGWLPMSEQLHAGMKKTKQIAKWITNSRLEAFTFSAIFYQ